MLQDKAYRLRLHDNQPRAEQEHQAAHISKFGTPLTYARIEGKRWPAAELCPMNRAAYVITSKPPVRLLLNRSLQAMVAANPDWMRNHARPAGFTWPGSVNRA